MEHYGITRENMVGTATRRATCRSCGGGRLGPVVDLGSTPIANALLRGIEKAADEARYPLEVVFCDDCALVQILDDVPLFPDDYPYYSSVSDALLAHSRAHVEGLVETLGLGPDSLIVEIASNDGYLLRNAVEMGIPALGIDAAPGPAEAARAVGVDTITGFFGCEMAERIRAERGTADAMVANNVMAHVPDLNDFVGGLAALLADDGVLTVENPGVESMIEHGEFDTIYHEHVAYYSCLSVQALMARNSLTLFDVEFFANLHGGTLRFWVARDRAPTARLRQRLDHELALGMDKIGFYEGFGTRVASISADLRDLVRGLRAEGKTVAAYGAAAKGATMLNTVGLGTDDIEFVVDRNAHKQGMFMPGTHQPILPAEALLERSPDYTLILAWNFADEIIRQQAAYAAQGGRFIVPVPEPKIVD